jgi:hypothetical protein
MEKKEEGRKTEGFASHLYYYYLLLLLLAA